MCDTSAAAPRSRSLWLRGLLMTLMAMAIHLAPVLLTLIAIVQFVLALSAPRPTPTCAPSAGAWASTCTRSRNS